MIRKENRKVDYFLGAAGAAAAAEAGEGPVGAAWADAILPPWTLNFVVQENSPSLWPTICSVMYTGRKSLPLWTANVKPTNSGGMSQSRAHVLMIFFSPLSICVMTFLRRRSST